MSSKGNFNKTSCETTLSAKEIKRRDRVFKDAIASCAIEGMHLSKTTKEKVKVLYRTYATSDEMVAQFKHNMGIKS